MASESDDPASHPDLDATGAALRNEWRAEQDGATADAAEQFRHNQTLGEYLIQTMHHGDRLAISVIGQRFSGIIEEVGPDVVAVKTLFGRVDIRVLAGIALHIEVVDQAASGGGRGANVANTFRAALLARENGQLVSVGTLTDPDGVDGELSVGADFVLVKARAGAVHTIPIDNIAWVTARRE